MREVMIGTSTFGLLHVTPMLMLEEGADRAEAGQDRARPLRAAWSRRRRGCEQRSSARRTARLLPRRRAAGHGRHPIYLNLKRFVERSSGVFGKSGTGKTFLTRMLLAGIIKENVAVNLIFDMHNEYGWKSQDEAQAEVKGPEAVVPIGQGGRRHARCRSSRRRGSKVDFDVTIGYDQLEPEDVEMLQGFMGLSDVQVGALYASIAAGPELDRALAQRRAARRRCRT